MENVGSPLGGFFDSHCIYYDVNNQEIYKVHSGIIVDSEGQ